MLSSITSKTNTEMTDITLVAYLRQKISSSVLLLTANIDESIGFL